MRPSIAVLPGAVRTIQDSGTLDDAGRQALGEILRRYAQGFIPAACPETVSQP
ncbi:MAG: hypothetical protein WDN50_12960 [Bradyrhizobium sp.]